MVQSRFFLAFSHLSLRTDILFQSCQTRFRCQQSNRWTTSTASSECCLRTMGSSGFNDNYIRKREWFAFEAGQHGISVQYLLRIQSTWLSVRSLQSESLRLNCLWLFTTSEPSLPLLVLQASIPGQTPRSPPQQLPFGEYRLLPRPPYWFSKPEWPRPQPRAPWCTRVGQPEYPENPPLQGRSTAVLGLPLQPARQLQLLSCHGYLPRGAEGLAYPVIPPTWARGSAPRAAVAPPKPQSCLQGTLQLEFPKYDIDMFVIGLFYNPIQHLNGDQSKERQPPETRPRVRFIPPANLVQLSLQVDVFLVDLSYSLHLVLVRLYQFVQLALLQGPPHYPLQLFCQVPVLMTNLLFVLGRSKGGGRASVGGGGLRIG